MSTSVKIEECENNDIQARFFSHAARKDILTSLLAAGIGYEEECIQKLVHEIDYFYKDLEIEKQRLGNKYMPDFQAKSFEFNFNDSTIEYN